MPVPPHAYKIPQSVLVVVHTAALQVLLIRRADAGTWQSVTGSKDDPDESWHATAVREVLEETGLEVTLGADLASVHYVDHRDRPKTVHYWAMTVVGGHFVPNDEVDEVRWVPIDDVAAILTYDIDRALLLDARPRLA